MAALSYTTGIIAVAANPYVVFQEKARCVQGMTPPGSTTMASTAEG